MGKNSKPPRPSRIRPSNSGQRRSPERIHSQDEINKHIADLMTASKRKRVGIEEFEKNFREEMSELRGAEIHGEDMTKYRQELDKGRQKALRDRKEFKKKLAASAPSASESSESETEKQKKSHNSKTNTNALIRQSRWDVAVPHWERTSSDESDEGKEVEAKTKSPPLTENTENQQQQQPQQPQQQQPKQQRSRVSRWDAVLPSFNSGLLSLVGEEGISEVKTTATASFRRRPSRWDMVAPNRIDKSIGVLDTQNLKGAVSVEAKVSEAKAEEEVDAEEVKKKERKKKRKKKHRKLHSSSDSEISSVSSSPESTPKKKKKHRKKHSHKKKKKSHKSDKSRIDLVPIEVE